MQATSTLSLEDRAEVDRRVGPLLGRLGVGAAGRAARRVAAELDAASVVRRMEEAARSRRVTVRPAPDGMAYLTVLAPLRETVGAYAALRARATAVVGGQCPDEAPEGRGVGAVMADTATRLMSGRAVGQVQPLEVHLVMTDTALLGPDARSRAGGPAAQASTAPRDVERTRYDVPDGLRDDAPRTRPRPRLAERVMEPARIPGHGSVPAPVARRWIREADEGSVWLRRLFTSPDGRDLVAMDSRRRVFTGLLRRLLVLRDDVCATPWCDGVIAHADHARPVRDGGTTAFENGNGRCARCNYVKEAPGGASAPPAAPDLLGTTPDSADDGAWHLADRPVAGATPKLRSRPRSVAATGRTHRRSSAGDGRGAAARGTAGPRGPPGPGPPGCRRHPCTHPRGCRPAR